MRHGSSGESMATNLDFWRGRRVFVTGATGLVGSWLVKDLLEVEATVVALVRDPDPQSEFFRSGDDVRTSIVQGTLEDFSTIERALNEHEIDTVMHLAAQPIVSIAHRNPLQTFESNIRGTYHVVEACRRFAIKRVVIASSDKAYGFQTELPYTENMSLLGRQPYEVSKSCADMIAQAYYHAYGLPVAIARCGNIFGGGDLNWSRIIPETIRSALRGVPVVLRSDGSFVRDYIYVKDVARAYMRLAEAIEEPRVVGEAFNFGPSRPLTVAQLVHQILQLMGCVHLEPIVRNTAQGEIHSQYLDSTKAQRILDWQPEYDLVRGLQETILWYKTYLSE
jgi:CDP-glucose 4,6-dehydratase